MTGNSLTKPYRMASNAMRSCDGRCRRCDLRPTEAAFKRPLENSWMTNCLSLFRKQSFNCLHDQRLRIATTIISQLSRILDEPLGIESHITALAMVIAVHPDRDVLGICNLVGVVLLTRDL